MTPLQTYKDMMSEFEKFKCIQNDCDGFGNIPVQVAEGEWEAEQCQFHAEYIFPIKNLIHTSFIKFLESEVEHWKGEKVAGGNYNCGEEGCCPKPEKGSIEEEEIDFQIGHNSAISKVIEHLEELKEGIQHD